MSRKFSDEKWLEMSRGDRVLLGIFAPFLTACLIAGSGMIVFLWMPEPGLAKIVKFLVEEMCLTLTLFSALVSIWAVAKPAWAKKMLERQLPKTFLWLFALSGATILISFAF